MSSFIFGEPVNMLTFDPTKFTVGSISWVSSTKIVITDPNGLTATLTGTGFVSGQPAGTITGGILRDGSQTVLSAYSLDLSLRQLYSARSSETALMKLLFGGDVTIRGSTGADVLVGGLSGAGTDYVNGGAGADTLYGEGAVNDLDGGPGFDKLIGKTGLSYASYRDATAGVLVDLLDPAKNRGDAAGDTYTNIHGVIGSNFNDVILCDNHGDTIDAGNGRDFITSGGAKDFLVGSLTGDDTYVYKSTSDSTPSAPDTISHWHTGDKINLSAIDANTTIAGHQNFSIGASTNTPGTIVITHSANLTVTEVSLYTNASGIATGRIYMEGDLTLTAADFVLTSGPTAQPLAQLSRFAAAIASFAPNPGGASTPFGDTPHALPTLLAASRIA